MHSHWENCLAHFDDGVDEFIADYFSGDDRRCLLVAGAGFDPRTLRIAQKLTRAMAGRIFGLFVREDRGDPAVNLRQMADNNEAKLRSIVPNSTVTHVEIFSPDDQAPVGGHKIRSAFADYEWPTGLTDIVLDVSALSMGVGFPAARLLLDRCERTEGLNFHLMIVSNPELDDQIVGEPSAQVQFVRRYSGPSGSSQTKPVARIWLPQLGRGRVETLRKIRGTHEGVYKVCPVVPFPARNPRRADELLAEYQAQLTNEWEVDARDLIYVSEKNPLDCYRTISILKKRYDRTFEDVFFPQIILSPFGSKVIAAGAMMAAIEHDLSVQYVETLRYEFNAGSSRDVDSTPDMAVHLWLHGPVYQHYDSEPKSERTASKQPADGLSPQQT
jgi:hypothetical protein